MVKKKGLTKAQRERMRADLLERQRWLRNETRAKNAEDGGLTDPERGGDEADQACTALNEALDLDLRERESRELQLIQEALARIEDGSYGRCEECGGQIALARLEALPFAEYCIDCQERLEEEGILLERPESRQRIL